MSENGPDNATVLNYIDKVYASLSRVWVLENRVTLTTVVLSLLLLTISLGAVSTEGTFSFVSLTLEMSLSGLLGGGIVVVTSLVIFSYCLSIRTTSLQNEIQRLYATIKYEEREAMADSLTGPFKGENVSILLLSPLLSERVRPKWKIVEVYDRIVAVSVLVLVLLLPVIAEVAALAKLASTVGWEHVWLWLPFVFFVLVTIASPISYILSGRGD